jgi:hypothetical protein
VRTCYAPGDFETGVDLFTHHVCHCQPCHDAISLGKESGSGLGGRWYPATSGGHDRLVLLRQDARRTVCVCSSQSGTHVDSVVMSPLFPASSASAAAITCTRVHKANETAAAGVRVAAVLGTAVRHQHSLP